MVSLSSRISPFTSTVILRDKVAAGDGGGHLGNVAHLGRQVAGHGVHRVGEILPRSGHARYNGLPTQFAVGAHLTGDARHFGGKRAQLVHHGVDGFFELKNFAAHIDGNFAGEIAAGNGGCDLGNVAYLAGQVAGHRVDGVGEVLPGTGHAGHHRLPTQLAVSADLARHARDLGGEHAELLNHGVDDVGGAQELAFQRPPVHIQAHGLGQIALGHGRDGAGNFRGWAQQILDKGVDRDFHLAPSPLDS